MINDLEKQIEKSCRFCNPPEKSRIIYESKNFYIMLSLGPIVEGYLLLVSKEHIGCCGEITNSLSQEFDSLYKNIKRLLTEIYGHCICYEHGRAGSCLIPLEGNKHCYHSHMHFVPANIQLNKAVQRDFDNIELESLNEFRSQYSKLKHPYLFIDDGQLNIYEIDAPIRRQYLRFKVARAVNQELLWDWVKYQNWELIESGKSKILPKIPSIFINHE